MIYFVGIHHKADKPALCSSTVSGKKIDTVIESLNVPCEKVNLFSSNFLPHKKDFIYERLIEGFTDSVPDGHTLVLLGNQVAKHFNDLIPGYPNSKIIYFRHPAFSGNSYVNDLTSVIIHELQPPSI